MNLYYLKIFQSTTAYVHIMVINNTKKKKFTLLIYIQQNGVAKTPINTLKCSERTLYYKQIWNLRFESYAQGKVFK